MKILPNEETKKTFKPFAILIESSDEARAIDDLIHRDTFNIFTDADYSDFYDARIRAEKGE